MLVYCLTVVVVGRIPSLLTHFAHSLRKGSCPQFR